MPKQNGQLKTYELRDLISADPFFQARAGRLHVKIYRVETADPSCFKRRRHGFEKARPPSTIAICLTCDCPASQRCLNESEVLF